MPALADRGTESVDMSGYKPVEVSPPSTGGIPSTNLEPGLNTFLRCPLPPIWTTPPDSLRQYYQNAVVPQVRLFNPPPVQNGSGPTTINNYGGSSSSGGGSGGGSGGTSPIPVAQTAITTVSIGPNTSFVGSVTLSRAFQLLSVNSSAPCRVRLYGTAAAQSADSYRGLDIPLPAGTIQNVICDIVLDTSPFQWTFQDRVGANGDTPVSPTTYITVTNLDSTTDAITVSFSYVPIVS